MHTLDLNLSDISKIEGKATLIVKAKEGKIIDLKFKIAKYKRFYAQAIREKDILALPQLTSRICGTCSNAHLICTIKAVENALGIIPSLQTKILRQLINFGLIIRDHALHLYIFALPDILGIDNILDLDENDPKQHQLLHDVFNVKAAGNILGKIIGGRSVHAPYPIVGGFAKLPDGKTFPKLILHLKKARPAVLRLIQIFYKCNFKLEENYNFVALLDKDYSFLKGKILISNSQSIEEKSFGNYLKHIVIPYSQASGYKFATKLHMVGALARVNLAKEKLHPQTRKELANVLSFFPSKNIFHNNLAQAIEILHAIDTSIDILKNLKIIKEKPIPIERKAGSGIGVIEAPRGTLFYKLNIDNNGKIKNGEIVVPTSQNQLGIENSIYHYLKANLNKEKDVIIHEIEKIIRAFDPCMSCASHFLKVRWL